MAKRLYSRDGNLCKARKSMGKRTYIGIALDRSGSMQQLLGSTVSGFNEHLETIQSDALKGGTTKMSLVTFGNNTVTTEFLNLDPKKVRSLHKGAYRPSGNTPMYDGVGRLIDELAEFDVEEADVGFLVLVISDGQENASRLWNQPGIANRINALKNTGRWTFAYVGANQNLFEVTQFFGQNNVLSWEYTPKGTEYVYDVMCTSTSAYLGARAAGETSKSCYFSPTITGDSIVTDATTITNVGVDKQT
ncbi:MAG: VWA domain-containing protein [Bacteroidales bacterium]|nr:VWA domain-containing protein [Candidatus Latescibacterota bacterium]